MFPRLPFPVYFWVYMNLKRHFVQDLDGGMEAADISSLSFALSGGWWGMAPTVEICGFALWVWHNSQAHSSSSRSSLSFSDSLVRGRPYVAWWQAQASAGPRHQSGRSGGAGKQPGCQLVPREPRSPCFSSWGPARSKANSLVWMVTQLLLLCPVPAVNHLLLDSTLHSSSDPWLKHTETTNVPSHFHCLPRILGNHMGDGDNQQAGQAFLSSLITSSKLLQVPLVQQYRNTDVLKMAEMCHVNSAPTGYTRSKTLC